MNILKTTEQHKNYWKRRKIDWDKAYFQTWTHPHRQILCAILKNLDWQCLMEIGCGSGPNLVQIVKQIPGKQLGGIDINADAIDLAKKMFKGGVFFVNSADDIMMSDKSSDVILSDMCLIYVSPFKIDKYIKEIKRVTRKYVVFCEFHHDSFLKRLWLKWTSGYNAYDWDKLFKKHNFYDVIKYKLKPEDWPGGNPQKDYGYIFVARVPYYN